MKVEAEGAEPHAALIIDSEVVDTEERFAVPFGEEVPECARLLIPFREGPAADHKAAALVECDTADKRATRNQGFDFAVRTAPVNAAVAANIAVVESILIVDAGSFDQSVAGCKGFEFHTMRSLMPLASSESAIRSTPDAVRVRAPRVPQAQSTSFEWKIVRGTPSPAESCHRERRIGIAFGATDAVVILCMLIAKLLDPHRHR